MSLKRKYEGNVAIHTSDHEKEDDNGKELEKNQNPER
jgi:hypothetical protein